jgi:hypothetical protein
MPTHEVSKSFSGGRRHDVEPIGAGAFVFTTAPAE